LSYDDGLPKKKRSLILLIIIIIIIIMMIIEMGLKRKKKGRESQGIRLVGPLRYFVWLEKGRIFVIGCQANVIYC